VFGGLNRLLVAALLAGAFFVAPSAALACGGGPSAVNVYKECLPTGGQHASGGQSGGSTHISNKTAKVLLHAGKNRRALAALVKGNNPPGLLQSNPEESSPSAVGSAVDLSSAPTALLIALAGTAALLLAGSGLRFWRRSHRA
jgi:hypothetical protein